MAETPATPDPLADYRGEIDRISTEYNTALRRMVNTKNKLKTVVLASIKAGMSENEASKLAAVTRKTVRDWQGKK
ncbi:hypothetical protein [Arthrobacter sp. B1I2]|uniref:hypothetical protein n=1 Tax=Arthrobacter sp. B1I2 TaxID=3042263 RepID=UPI0027802738|nr:hypothetical protein [Arthrobacter sp. B1I2]MDQ0733482.1 hypothetical protein [Arthrobacter sp. B1I2]